MTRPFRALRIALAAAAVAPAARAEDAAPAPGIPFELEAHRVFVPVRVGDSRPLRLFRNRARS